MSSLKINPNDYQQSIEIDNTLPIKEKTLNLSDKTQLCSRNPLLIKQSQQISNCSPKTSQQPRKIHYVSLEATVQQNKHKIQILGQKTYTDRLGTQKIGLLLEEIKQIFKKNQQISLKASPRSAIQNKQNCERYRQSVDKAPTMAETMKMNKDKIVDQRKSQCTNKNKYFQIDQALLIRIQSILYECKRQKQQNKKGYLAILDKYQRTIQQRNRTISNLIENVRMLQKKIEFTQLSKAKNLNLEKTFQKKSQQDYSKIIRRKLINEIIQSNKQANFNLHQSREKNCEEVFRKSMKSSFSKHKPTKKYPLTNNQKQNVPIKMNKYDVFELKISKYKLKNHETSEQKIQKIGVENEL